MEFLVYGILGLQKIKIGGGLVDWAAQVFWCIIIASTSSGVRDRVLFFIDYLPRSGSYTVSYHARVTSAGSVVAPPAKVEAMYEPEFFALSASHKFTTPNPLHTAAR